MVTIMLSAFPVVCLFFESIKMKLVKSLVTGIAVWLMILFVSFKGGEPPRPCKKIVVC